MRTDRLLKVALEAELLRQRRRVRRIAIQCALGAIGGVFLCGALAWFEVAVFLWVHLNLGTISSTLIVVGANLLAALILVAGGYAIWGRPGRIEIEALEVRMRAQQQLDSIVTFAATLAGPAGWLLRRSRLLGIVAAILLPRFVTRFSRRH